ncbi:hypothetical protein EZMO1_4779 [Endozoicomonas montiporae CL-33]|uniref:Uncharacterized protein n=1 Tax=Endozoicomonas montiporae CL-33 TaxID=570277 RepID=A0A142BIV4_9GAMM|nr:hypothetical protein EZMO1_4779 [Endozoicomonas montiporae CL-33]
MFCIAMALALKYSAPGYDSRFFTSDCHHGQELD